MILYMLDMKIVICMIKRCSTNVLQTFNQHTGRLVIQASR